MNHRLAHSGKVDYAWNAGEVLHYHSGRSELDFSVWLGLWVPIDNGFDVGGSHVCAIFGSKEILEQNLEAVRKCLSFKLGHVKDSVLLTRNL